MKTLYTFVAHFSRSFKPQSDVPHESNIFLPSRCLANYPLLVVKNAPLLLKRFLRLKRQQSALCHPLNNSLLTVPVQTSSTRVKDSIKRMRTRKRDGSTKGSNSATCQLIKCSELIKLLEDSNRNWSHVFFKFCVI